MDEYIKFKADEFGFYNGVDFSVYAVQVQNAIHVILIADNGKPKNPQNIGMLTGSAYCHEGDTFDFDYGVRLAVERAIKKDFPMIWHGFRRAQWKKLHEPKETLAERLQNRPPVFSYNHGDESIIGYVSEINIMPGGDATIRISPQKKSDNSSVTAVNNLVQPVEKAVFADDLLPDNDPANPWIPVGERLPEIDEKLGPSSIMSIDVQALTTNKEIFSIAYCVLKKRNIFDIGDWPGTMPHKITHWRYIKEKK